jgi:hypothetical protein
LSWPDGVTAMPTHWQRCTPIGIQARFRSNLHSAGLRQYTTAVAWMCPRLRHRLRMSRGVTDRRDNGDLDSKSEHGALIGLPKTICIPRVARTLLVRNHTMMRSHSNLVAGRRRARSRSPVPSTSRFHHRRRAAGCLARFRGRVNHVPKGQTTMLAIPAGTPRGSSCQSLAGLPSRQRRDILRAWLPPWLKSFGSEPPR